MPAPVHRPRRTPSSAAALPPLTRHRDVARGVLVDHQRAHRGRRRTCARRPPRAPPIRTRAPDGSVASVIRLPNPSTSTTWTLPTGSAGEPYERRPHRPAARRGDRSPEREVRRRPGRRGRGRGTWPTPARAASGDAPTSNTSSIPEALRGRDEQPVVRSDEPARRRTRIATARRAPPTPGSTTARCTPGGRERQRPREPPRARAHVLRRHAVPEVHHPRRRRDPRDHALDHADVLVARARSR